MAFLAKSTASISQVSFSLAPPSSQICSAQQLTSPVSCGKLPIDALSVSIPRSSAQILCLKGGIVHRRAPLPKLLASTQSLALQSSLSSSSLRFASSSLVMNHLLGIQGTELVSFMDGVGALDKVRSGARAALSDETLRWTFVAAAMVVMLVRGSSVRKEFVVPLVALELPQDILSYMRGEYGLWAAFLALAVRLFYYIPGELELL